MQGQKINLKWTSFQSNILSSFESMWEEEGFVDVTLAADGKCLKAHKIVLSASSPFFKKIFQMNPCQHPVVVLQDVHFSALESILKFVYKGEVCILQDNLPLLLRAAETLQIRGLCRQLNNEPNQEEDSNLQNENSEIVSHNEKSLALKTPPSSPKSSKKVKSHHGFPSALLSSPSVSPTVELTVPVYPVTPDKIKCEPDSESPPTSEDRNEYPLCLTSSLQERTTESDEEHDFSSITRSAFDIGQGSANFPFSPFPCPFCDRAYSRWGFRRRHIKACHTRSQSLPCKWCLEVLPNHTEWESHVCLKHSLSRNDARNGLLILEEAEVVLQIPQPSRLDELVTMIKEQNKTSEKISKIVDVEDDNENESEINNEEKQESWSPKW